MWNDLAEHIGIIVIALFATLKGVAYLYKTIKKRDEKDIDEIKNLDLREIYRELKQIRYEGFGKIYDRIAAVEHKNSDIETNYLKRFATTNKLIYERTEVINIHISEVQLQVTKVISGLNSLECVKGNCPIK